MTAVEKITPADWMGAADTRALFDAITAPTLVLRGNVSEVLTAETAQEMTGRGPRAELVTFAGVTHPLWLTDEEQIGTVREFLER